MVIAVIDMGTNTFHCLIVRITGNGNHEKLFKTKTAVKLGEGGINRNIIQEKPFRRGIDTIIEYKKIIDKFGAEKIYACGTAALRSASNGSEFIDAIYRETGIKTEIISGALEAEYIYYGVRTALNMGTKDALIIDIGGGSVEFIIADQFKMKWAHSFDLGAARLLDIFKPSDPITSTEIEEIENYLNTNLSQLFEACKLYNPETLIGSSGSFDTFAEMISYQYYTPDILKNKTEYHFSISEFLSIHKNLIASKRIDRENMKGLIPMRIDMIVVASIFVEFILRKLRIKEMKLSTHALKEGILWYVSKQKI